MNKLIYTFIIICFSLFTTNGQIVINEYSAANYDTYADNYGEYQDWVELYNPTATAIDISGWALTDKPSNATKWTFPSSFFVPANGVVLIYCSGRDELIGANAHTNFKITQTKGSEVLMLSDAGGVFQDSIRVLPSQNSHTRGRTTNGSANWSVFLNGTPNLANTGASQEYEPTPIFSSVSGYQNAPISLSISSASAIYYTLNGDVPNTGSTAYSGAININATTVVKAIAININPSIPPSFIEYGTFFFGLDIHTIPILSISGDGIDDLLVSNGSFGGTVAPYSKPFGTIEYFDKNGLLIDKGSGEYNRHGNDSWAYDQRGFDYIMRDQFGYNYALKDKIFETKDRNKFQRLIIKAAANDNYPASGGAHIRDSYVHHLSQLAELKLDERSYAPCILYKNGEYWGVYDIREKVDDADFLDYYYDQDEKYKDSPEYIQYLKYWGAISTEYGAPNAGTDWLTLKNYITSNSMAINANYQNVKNQYNTGSIIDYFLLNSYVVASDWLNWNTGWWRGLDPNGDKKKWRYELWDMDNTFDHGANFTGIPNQGATADPCAPDSLPNPGGQWGQVPIWNALQDNASFFDDYLNRWQDLANGYFSCDSMLAVLNRMIGVIDPEMNRQITTWGGSYNDWEDNVNDLRDFITQRCAYMNTAFIPCYPALSGPYNVTVEIIGIGEVEMSNGNFINQNNTGWTDQRFGGIDLPFKVVSGTFNHWEVIPSSPYIYDSIVDTLAINLQGDVTVQAYFIPPTPTRDITYNIVPAGTATNIIVDGTIINTFPTTINYTINDTVNIDANIDPLYGFSAWQSDSVNLMPINTNKIDSFYATNHDNISLIIYELPNAFISGDDTICDNAKPAKVSVNFIGAPSFTFVYAIDGVSQPSIQTTVNPYIINTKKEGIYTLLSFSDTLGVGRTSGSARVTVLEPPIANFEAQPDSMTIIYTTTKMIDESIEGDRSIVSWNWNFGDNTPADSARNPYHTYKDTIGVYQISLIIVDNFGCTDTTFNQVQITNKYWMYVPNSFTPDLDGINDVFCIQFNGVRKETFYFNVYDRFSTLVYSTANITDLVCELSSNGWDGKHYKTGNDLPMGTYIYEMYFQDFEGWKHQESGQIIIIK